MTAITTGRERRPRRWWMIAGIVLVVLAIIAAVFISTRSSSATSRAPATVAVSRGNVVATVAGTGTIKAAQSLDLAFETNGTVAKVLVAEGDTVTAGQPLALIDTRDLQAQVDSAQANLSSAQAALEQAKQGNATPQDLAAQQASVTNAEANLSKTRTGTTTAADIAQAEASLRSAQAKLDALKNPSQAQTSAQQLKVNQAQSDLTSTRDSSSQAKTNAELALRQSTDTLTQQQAAYSSAKRNYEYAQSTSNDPNTPETTNSKGEKVANTLSDGQRQQYAQTYVQAQASLNSAELDVQKAQVAYDKARQDEVRQVQQAEATLANEQQQLAALLNPSKNDVIQAQANVDQAKASLAKLRQGGSKAEVAAAQATVDQAKANLDKLNAPATASDIQIKQASVAQSEQSLKQANINLEKATLTAPFNAVVSAVNIVPGSAVGSTSAAFSLVNRNPLHIDMSLSENDVAKVQTGQKVNLTVDALTGWTAAGTVGYIAPASTESNGVVTYKVRVDFPGTEAQVKVGMTANISITTAQKDGVLLVPNSALLPMGASHAVQVTTGTGASLQTKEIGVETGLSDGTYTEVVSGVTEGQQIVATPSTNAKSSNVTPFGG